jgi:N6-L-threonylcarbamoyladenine synthase
MNKLKKAAVETGIRNICLSGGVSANTSLRKTFLTLGEVNHWNTFIPRFEYCTDNAAMIAIAAYYKYIAGDISQLSITASAKAEW